MLSFDEARRFLLERARPISGMEPAATGEALGRVLAQTQRSAIDVPPVDNSAMDGYAVATVDISAGRVTRLPIAQRIAAGSIGQPLVRGTAARIFTGAPIPPGADAVVMQEHCASEGGEVIIRGAVRVGDNIRRAGEDIAVGDELLAAGIKLRPQEMGLAASVGLAQLPVYRRLRVAIFSTGDELVAPGEPLTEGKIYNSNRFTLLGLLTGLNCAVVDLGSVRDTLEATRGALSRAADGVDLIITSGGVSVGEEDHVRAALDALGQVDMWRVAMKPGKPLAYGDVAGTPFLGLPGNPVSAFITFVLFARPFILRCQGVSAVLPRSLPAKAGFEWPKPGPRREFLRARLEATAGGAQAAIYPKQGSGVLTSTVWADGLVVVPERQSIARGDSVEFISFNELLC